MKNAEAEFGEPAHIPLDCVFLRKYDGQCVERLGPLGLRRCAGVFSLEGYNQSGEPIGGFIYQAPRACNQGQTVIEPLHLPNE